MIFIYSKPHFNPTVPIYHQYYYALFLTLPQKQLCLTVTVGPKAQSAPSTHVIGSSSRPKGLCGGLRRHCASGPWFQPTTAKVTWSNQPKWPLLVTQLLLGMEVQRKSNSPDVILEGSGPCPCVQKSVWKMHPEKWNKMFLTCSLFYIFVSQHVLTCFKSIFQS